MFAHNINTKSDRFIVFHILFCTFLNEFDVPLVVCFQSYRPLMFHIFIYFCFKDNQSNHISSYVFDNVCKIDFVVFIYILRVYDVS